MAISWLSDKPASKDWPSLMRKPTDLAAVVVDNVVAKFDNTFVKFPAIFQKKNEGLLTKYQSFLE